MATDDDRRVGRISPIAAGRKNGPPPAFGRGPSANARDWLEGAGASLSRLVHFGGFQAESVLIEENLLKGARIRLFDLSRRGRGAWRARRRNLRLLGRQVRFRPNEWPKVDCIDRIRRASRHRRHELGQGLAPPPAADRGQHGYANYSAAISCATSGLSFSMTSRIFRLVGRYDRFGARGGSRVSPVTGSLASSGLGSASEAHFPARHGWGGAFL